MLVLGTLFRASVAQPAPGLIWSAPEECEAGYAAPGEPLS